MKIFRKIIKAGFISVLIFITTSCENNENVFSDFDYTTSYFPWQYPVRTLVLGESFYYDNTNDINHRFEIKASVGGIYNNEQNRQVVFEIDQSLVDGLYFANGVDTLKLDLLPSNYYGALNTDNFIIPKGSFNGGFTVQLTDAFFDDPLSCKNKYVLPVRILSAETDSVLRGMPQSAALPSIITSVSQKWGVDPRIKTDWLVRPQDYTIYAIKFANKYHGNYLRRGLETDENIIPNLNKGYGWENIYIEKTTFIPKLETLSLDKLLYADMLAVSKLNFRAILTVDGNNVTINSESPVSDVQVTGSGSFSTDKEEWGEKKRIAFYLDYQVSNSATGKSYSVMDTLVIRDNAVAVEEFDPIVKL